MRVGKAPSRKERRADAAAAGKWSAVVDCTLQPTIRAHMGLGPAKAADLYGDDAFWNDAPAQRPPPRKAPKPPPRPAPKQQQQQQQQGGAGTGRKKKPKAKLKDLAMSFK